MTLDEMRQEAARRRQRWQGNPNYHPMTEDHELMGVVGENEFARVFRRPYGPSKGFDKGVDFPVRGHTVNVKASRGAKLMLKPGMTHLAAKIFVLAAYRDNPKPAANLVGWAWGKDLVKAPLDQSLPYPAHAIHKKFLKPISELQAMLMPGFNTVSEQDIDDVLGRYPLTGASRIG